MPTARVDIGELSLNLRWAGAEDPGAPVLVFVNGLLTDLSSWTAHLEHFGDYRCLVYDCRGQGASDKPEAEAYAVADHGRDLGALLDALGLDEVSIIGLSNGGAAALHLAAAQPERVRALVVSGAYARVDTILRVKLRAWIAAMAAGGGPLRFDVATPWVWGPEFLARNWESLLGYRDKAMALDLDAARRLIAGAMIHDLDDAALAKIRARTLISVGEHDLLTPPWDARAMAAAIPNAKLERHPGLGHAAALEDVPGFCEIARAFLAGSHLELR
ncbi:alpha/beta fold hydrolase [Pseudenhygromyxa sp. WMMC2535]|uniref:alpha/beta fold hydrolase n=1 Tax=Pseudenhygromyxa sp. WMMC2535 TaxID=2712867 RepID=UPI0015538486|nr:alpha/beta hydrolase [Pseudenhygromyxa sp. WMMC2535]NVB43320.1 alpha/beta fold hydrolase [Pseudenhygromyxa sp. WMMC2535]